MLGEGSRCVLIEGSTEKFAELQAGDSIQSVAQLEASLRPFRSHPLERPQARFAAAGYEEATALILSTSARFSSSR